MRLELQKQKLEFEQEAKRAASKGKELEGELQAQCAEALQTRDKMSEENKALKEALQASKEKCKEQPGEYAAAGKPSEKQTVEWGRFLQAAQHMKPAELQYVHYQISSMLANAAKTSYKVPAPMYMSAPQMPAPYYQYQMQ